jgi:hypothetical protein
LLQKLRERTDQTGKIVNEEMMKWTFVTRILENGSIIREEIEELKERRQKEVKKFSQSYI